MLTRGSLKRKDAPDAVAVMPSSAAADLHHMSLRRLVRHRHWSTLIERIRAHPEVIRKTTPCEKGGYYTILHTVMFHRQYNDDYDFVVPVIKAILAAADEIDYTPLRRQQEEDQLLSESRGSWRLLLDNNNYDGVSPFHALCDNSAFCNVPLLKILLQMDENDDMNIVDANQHQHNIITLCDSLGRNIIHRFFRSCPPRHVCVVIRFAVALSPSLLYQRNIHGRSPLETATTIFSPHRWGIHGPSGANIMRRIYSVLKLLIYCLELDTRGVVREIWTAVNENEAYPIINSLRQNVLHWACILPYNVCPPDGVLIEYLSDPYVSQLEANDRDMWREPIDMAAERDENGNLPLHLFLSNNTWPNSQLKSSEISTEVNMIYHLSLSTSFYAFSLLNYDDKLPVKLAMQSGRKFSTCFLVLMSANAIFFDDSMNDVKLFTHLLCLLSSASIGIDMIDRCHFLNATFILLRGRPELLSHGFP